MAIQTPELNNKILTEYGTYLWDPSWVRPYESPYSVVRNFCRINAMNGANFQRVFKIDNHYESRFVPALAAWGKTPKKNGVQILGNLMPEGYRTDLAPFPNRELNEDLNPYTASQIKRFVCYCPLCEKDGYHSDLHNVVGIEICPFHHVPLIETDIEYAIDPVGITYGKDNIMDCSRVPLPFERVNPNSFYERGDFSSIPDLIIPIRIKDEASVSPDFANLFLNKRQPSAIIQGLNIQADEIQFRKLFSNYINTSLVKKYIWGLEYYRIGKHITSYQYDDYGNADELSYMLAKYIDEIMKPFASPINSYRLSRNKDVIYNGMRIDAEDDFFLNLCFVWAYTGEKKPVDALREYKTLHPYRLTEPRPTTDFRLSLDQTLRWILWKQLRLFDSTDTLMILLIQQDYFFYMLRQYKNIAKKRGWLDSRNGWKELVQPEYFIIKQKDKVFAVRYNEQTPVL